MKKIKLIAVFVFIVSGLGTSHAQEAVSDSIRKNVNTDLKEKKADVKILLDKIEILGRIDKPQTVFILPGRDPVVDDIQIDRSFFKEIFREVERDIINKKSQKARLSKILRQTGE